MVQGREREREREEVVRLVRLKNGSGLNGHLHVECALIYNYITHVSEHNCPTHRGQFKYKYLLIFLLFNKSIIYCPQQATSLTREYK